jgi:uncharacterized protein
MLAYKDFVDTACKDCAHITYCRGGCPYNAIAPTGGTLIGVDPHCIAYKRIFDEITTRMNDEMNAAPTMSRVSRVKRQQKPSVMGLIKKIVEE